MLLFMHPVDRRGGERHARFGRSGAGCQMQEAGQRAFEINADLGKLATRHGHGREHDAVHERANSSTRFQVFSGAASLGAYGELSHLHAVALRSVSHGLPPVRDGKGRSSRPGL